MKLQTWLLLLAALVILSTLAGITLLVYLHTLQTPQPAATATVTVPLLVTPTATVTSAAAALPTWTATTAPTVDPTVLPPLVTPTWTPTSSATSTPTQTETPTPTVTSTQTATPTFTPSPTLVPSDLLAAAHRAKRNGDYRRAQAEFSAAARLPAVGPDADTAIEAAFQAGVCAFLDGSYEQADDLLTRFVQTYSQDHRVGVAHFYLAETRQERGDLPSAISHYNAYLSAQDVLADLVYRQIGNHYVTLGQYQTAIEAYQHALDKTTDLGQQYDLREQIGQTFSTWGRYDEAITWFSGVIERSENVYRLARLWYLTGLAHRLAGREADALQAFAQAVNGDPRPGYAHAALVELVQANVPVNEYQRGLINYHAGSYQAAIAAFERYTASMPDYNGDAHYYAAMSWFNTQSFAAAIDECRRMIERFSSTTPRWGDAWLLQARAWAAQQQWEDAVQVYLDFARANPEHTLAGQALWDAAWLLETNQQMERAAALYASLGNTYPNHAQAGAAWFRSGLCRYRQGDRAGAITAWRELAARYPQSDAGRQGRYWLGKTLWLTDGAKAARAVLKPLADEAPRDYYGLRAAHLLAQNGRPANWIATPARLRLVGDEAAERQEAAAWLRTWAGAAQDTDPAIISPNLSGDIRFRRAVELLGLERRPQARDELDSLRRDLAQSPVQLYQLALFSRDVGLYAVSLRASLNLIALTPGSVLTMPRLIQRLAFPAYFDDLIVAESNAQQLDALLMFALVRQESVFDDQVYSWAGAVGLAQVMPSTGEWIADMMPWPDYRSELLLRPYLNIKFGVWFLARVLTQADNHVMVALAGYNGGPANATRWAAQANGDPDLFVEVITRSEPQLYVREIYRQYEMYVLLYGK